MRKVSAPPPPGSTAFYALPRAARAAGPDWREAGPTDAVSGRLGIRAAGASTYGAALPRWHAPERLRWRLLGEREVVADQRQQPRLSAEPEPQLRSRRPRWRATPGTCARRS
jgi:hypothetical protein